MVRFLGWLLLVLAISSVSLGTVAGQEFRVYTRVYDLGTAASSDGAPIVGRSVSLFRAGKAYDFMPAVDEVIVFEPARPHRRFTILNIGRKTAATITFDELNAMLKIARQQTEAGVSRMRSEGDPALTRAVEALSFQLEPKFEETFESASRRLVLNSVPLRYEAVGADPAPSAEFTEAYLRYADWICRLNYVLHPGLLLPEPRLAVNERLRRHGLMPVEVELQAEVDARLHLRAQHQIDWSLDAKDRSLINDWETLLKSPTIERMTIHDYQRALLISQTGRGK